MKFAALGITEVVNLATTSAARWSRRAGFLRSQGDQDRRLLEVRRTGVGADRPDYRQLAPAHLDWVAGLSKHSARFEPSLRQRIG